MILSGAKAYLGSMKEDRILLHFLHSAVWVSARWSPSEVRRGVEGQAHRPETTGEGYGDPSLHASTSRRRYQAALKVRRKKKNKKRWRWSAKRWWEVGRG
jgi:hypothetical protein